MFSRKIRHLQLTISIYIYSGNKIGKNLKPQVAGEPILLNPNCYQNIDSILQSFKYILQIGEEREWALLGCDSPPYCLSSRIIERNSFKHDWVSIISGLGHLNMNQLKTFFKIVNEICLEPLGKKVLHFQSPKAYKYFVDCKDNHKAWQSFEILLHVVILKVLELYRNSTCETPSALGILNFISETENATLSLISEIFLSFGLAIYIQRIGNRNNDFTVSSAGRYKFFDLFYAFNHSIYCKVEYRELKNKVIYPEEIKNVLNENITFSATDITGKCQEGDFILEGKIKKQKNIAPKGAVTAKTWQKILCSIDIVDDIVENASQLGIFDILLSRNIITNKRNT